MSATEYAAVKEAAGFESVSSYVRRMLVGVTAVKEFARSEFGLAKKFEDGIANATRPEKKKSRFSNLPTLGER
jgi:hypothetical protein